MRCCTEAGKIRSGTGQRGERKMRKLFAGRTFLAGLAAMAIAAFGTVEAKADKLQDILSKGVVRIGVPLDAPPFGSQDANRKAVGFDIELAEMVAKGLGVKLEMQQITGANRIPFLLTDKVDIVISVMGLSPERARQ
ncbi:MAG: transporter substrate-binding domain-containing protein, partial [Hyphomicrobiales bacterium]